MADPSESARPNRLYALLSVIGGGLMIGAFFLPERITPDLTSNTGSASPHVISMWNVVYQVGVGVTTYVPRDNVTVSSQPHVLEAILAGLPLAMAVLIVVLGIWSLVRRSGALRAGFFGAASVLATLGAAGNALFNNADINSGFYAGTGAPPVPNEAWLGLGSVVLLLGLLLVLAAGIAAASQRAA